MISNVLKRLAVSVEEIDENNAWGFGGRVGKMYKFGNKSKIFVGRNCYRHAPSQPITTYYIPTPEGSECMFRSVGKKEFMEYSK